MSAVTGTSDAERLAREFFDAWQGRDIEKIMSFMADDAVYHNIPVAPIQGTVAVREIFGALLSVFEQVKFDIRHLAAKDGVVLTERIDYFVKADGTKVELPVMGALEIRDGKIASFRDYFDLADFERQSGMKL